MKLMIWITLLVGVALSACSKEPPEIATPATFTLSTTSGPPGTVVTISGLNLVPDSAPTFVWIGDELAPSILQDDGTIRFTVPLFLGPDNWPSPPSEPQMVEVRGVQNVLGSSSQGFTVTPLQEAPGSLQVVYEAYTDIIDVYETLWAAIPISLEQEAPLREAILEMLKGLIADGENSLKSVLEGTAPLLEGEEVNLALMDALLSSSGARDYLSEYASAFKAGTAEAQAALSSQALLGLCDGDGDDVHLACMMQIYVILDNYSRAFVKPTAETYANTVGLAAGILAMGAASVPAHAIVSAILGVADFIMEKVAPALFPSKITHFDLKLERSTIEVGEVTESTITIAAVNNPPAITHLDIFEQAKTLLGLKDLPKEMDLFYKVLRGTAEFVIDLYLRVIKGYEAKHPGSFGWVTAGDIRVPRMTWGPLEIKDPRLVNLLSYNKEIAEELEDELKWKGVSLGETKVEVRPRGSGSKSKILKDHALCWGCIYYGGAFGEEMSSSTAKLIVGEIALTATPDMGKAPLTTTFSWTGLEPQEEPYTCILEVGDGSTMYSIPDCANTTSQAHTYLYTSALQTESGKYQATLKVAGSEKSAVTEVLVDWVFTATPTQGQAPLDITFNWSGFDPEGGAASCTLDFGDGSPARTLNDCLSTKTATHRYTNKGGYVPSLTVRGALGQTVKTAQVSVGQQLCAPTTDTSEKCVGEARFVMTGRWISGTDINEARDEWTFTNIEFVYDEVNSTASASYFYVAKATLVNYERQHSYYDQITGDGCETYESASSITLVNPDSSIEGSEDSPLMGWLFVLHEEADGFPAGAYSGNAAASFDASYTRTCTDGGNLSESVLGGAELFSIPGPENYGPGDTPEPYIVQPGGILSGTYSFSIEWPDGYESGEFSWHFEIPDLP